jgi:ADP-ribose pyrophosphatase
VKARFRAPDGGEFERDIVRHPGAVAVVPWHDDGTLTLVRQYRASLEHDLLEVPAGVRDVHGEPDVRTAERELAEEAGLAASSMERLVTLHNAPGMSDEQITIFLAQGLVAVAGDPQGEEEQAMTIERVALADALDMIDDGRITDAKTMVGVLLLARRLA